LELMRLFPDYKFFASQSLLYKYVKEDNPLLFEEIKTRIKEGRWNAGGGTLVQNRGIFVENIGNLSFQYAKFDTQ